MRLQVQDGMQQPWNSSQVVQYVEVNCRHSANSLRLSLWRAMLGQVQPSRWVGPGRVGLGRAGRTAKLQAYLPLKEMGWEPSFGTPSFSATPRLCLRVSTRPLT